MRASVFGLSCLLLFVGYGSAIDLDVNSTSSIKSAAKTIAGEVMSLYKGDEKGEIPGLFPSPYYWWESGLAWDSMINYWALTGDDTYNDRVAAGMLWQIGPNDDYMVPNQTKSEGNDDQSTWALACMTAAEQDFPYPKGDGGPGSWVKLAQNVFDTQVARWDTSNCGGGLRWQIYSFNSGYTYKNALSNGNLMQLSARLGAYTGNATYYHWASKIDQWSTQLGLVAAMDNSDEDIRVYDGFQTGSCSKPNKLQWTANLGTYLSAYVYLEVPSKTYVGIDQGLVDNVNITFLDNNVIVEQACEPNNSCDTDQQAFRAILVRALARTQSVLSSGHHLIPPILQSSAKAAAAQCSGGKSGTTCGSDWTMSTYDGSSGLGQDLSALEAILSILPQKKARNENGTTTSGGGSSPTATGSSGTSSPTGKNAATAHSISTLGMVAAFTAAFMILQ